MKVRTSQALLCAIVLTGVAVAAAPRLGKELATTVSASLQVQTKCTNPTCNGPATLQEDWKFCPCGTKTDYGKYSDSLKAGSDSEAKGDYRAASRAYLEAAIRRVNDVRKAAALVGAGRNYLALKEISNAQKELDKARNLNPKDPEAALLLGQVCVENKDFARAEAFFREANQLSGKDNYSAIFIGDIAYDRKDYAEARRQYLLAEPDNAQNYRLALRLGLAFRAGGQNNEAIERLERAHGIEPKQIEPIVALAEIYGALNRYRDSAGMYGQASMMFSSSADYPLKEAGMYAKAQDWDKAHAAYQVAYGRNSNSFEALLGMAQIELIYKNDIASAVNHLTSARRIKPEDLQVEFLYGLAKDLQDQKPNAFIVQHDAIDRAPDWHPAGTKIAFQSTRDKSNQIYVMEIGGKPERVSSVGQNGDPCWSPDGQLIAYHSNDKNVEIVVVDPQTKRETKLTNDPAADESPSWSPNGKQIAFMSKRGPTKKWNVYVMNANGSGVKALTNDKSNNELPKWSPDGSKILFVSDRSGKKKLWVMDVDGSNPRMLTKGTDDEGFACWSPEGDRIAYGIEKNKKWKVYVMNADGSGSIPLNASQDSEFEASWNPNGIRIATCLIVETKAAGTTDAYGSPISGGIKKNYEIRVQLAPRR